MKKHVAIAVLLSAVAFTATAQLYRWTDEKGRVHITDTPPPPTAKKVEKKATPGTASRPAGEAQQPFEVAQAMKDFPVTLYTSPNCKEPCATARELLNKRSVPFKEVQVWDEKSNEELKRVSGGNDVPTLAVGRSVHRGLEADSWHALLDSARYPKSGSLPPRAQAAPAAPEGYVDERSAKPPAAQPGKLETEPPPPTGPYAPKPPRPQPR